MNLCGGFTLYHLYQQNIEQQEQQQNIESDTTCSNYPLNILYQYVSDTEENKSIPSNTLLNHKNRNQNRNDVDDVSIDEDRSEKDYKINRKYEEYEKLVIWVPLFNLSSSSSTSASPSSTSSSSSATAAKFNNWNEIEDMINKEPLDIGEQWLRRYILLPYSSLTITKNNNNDMNDNKNDFDESLITISSLTQKYQLHKLRKQNINKDNTQRGQSQNQIKKVSLSDFEITIRNLKKFLPIHQTLLTSEEAAATMVPPSRRSNKDKQHDLYNIENDITFQESSCVLPWLSGANMLIQLSRRNAYPSSSSITPSTKAMHMKLTNFEISCGCEIKYDEVGIGVSYRVVEALICLWETQSTHVHSSSSSSSSNRRRSVQKNNDNFNDDEEDFPLHQNGWFPFIFNEEIELKLSNILALNDNEGQGLYQEDEDDEKDRWLVAARDVALFVYLCVRAQVYDVKQIISCAFIAAPQVSLLCEEVGTLEYEMGCRNWHISDVFKKSSLILSPSFSISTKNDSKMNEMSITSKPPPPPPPPIFDISSNQNQDLQNTMSSSLSSSSLFEKTHTSSSRIKKKRRNQNNKMMLNDKNKTSSANIGCSSFFAISSLKQQQLEQEVLSKNQNQNQNSQHLKSKSSKINKKSSINNKKKGSNKLNNVKNSSRRKEGKEDINDVEVGVEETSNSFELYLSVNKLDHVLESIGCCQRLKHDNNHGRGDQKDDKVQNEVQLHHEDYFIESNGDKSEPSSHNSNHGDYDQRQRGREEEYEAKSDVVSVESEELLDLLENKVNHLGSLVSSLETSCQIHQSEHDMMSREEEEGGDGPTCFETMRGGDFDRTATLRRSFEFDLTQEDGDEEHEDSDGFNQSIFTRTNETVGFDSTARETRQDDKEEEDGVLMSKLSDALSNHIKNLYGL